MPAFSVCSTILSIHLAYVLTADFVNLFSISMSETNHLSLVLNAFIEVYKTSSMHADVLGTNQNYLVTWRRFFFAVACVSFHLSFLSAVVGAPSGRRHNVCCFCKLGIELLQIRLFFFVIIFWLNGKKATSLSDSPI